MSEKNEQFSLVRAVALAREYLGASNSPVTKIVHGRHIFIPNASISTDIDAKKIWRGELNITTQASAIAALAKEIDRILYVLDGNDTVFCFPPGDEYGRPVSTETRHLNGKPSYKMFRRRWVLASTGKER